MLQVFNNYYFYIFRRPSRNYNPNQNSYVDSEDDNDPRRRRKHEYDSADSSELCYPTSTSINTEQKSDCNHAPEENNNNDDDIEEKAKKIAENEALKQAGIEAKLKVRTFIKLVRKIFIIYS